MAYLKYKEITKYFYFQRSVDISTLPEYVISYLEKDEIIIKAYETKRDKGIFTNKKIVLFDVNLTGTKQIHIIPYKSISTLAILFKSTSGSILGFTDSGYPIDLRFVNLSPEDKTKLRILYTQISEKVCNK